MKMKKKYFFDRIFLVMQGFKLTLRSFYHFITDVFHWILFTTAQIKIYIETDLEGVSGVYRFSQTRDKGSPENLKACEYFMGDLAAVVRWSS